MTEHLLDGVLVRACVYVALALSLGHIAWAAWMEPGTRATLERWRRVVVATALVLAAVLALVHATLTFADRWSFAALRAVIADTEYGRRLGWFAGAAALHVVACMAMPKHRTAIGISALLVAVAIARIGHASVGPGWHVPAHVGHTLAVTTWTGGLIVLVQRIAHRSLSATQLWRFGRGALALVIVIIATGVVRTIDLVDTIALASPWPLVLATKLAFVAGALAVAVGHRRKRIPALQAASSEPAWRRMENMVVCELWLVGCALLLAGLLSQLDPP